MNNSMPAKSSENINSLEQTQTSGSWTQDQQRFLEILQHQEYQNASITKICQLAGYSSSHAWYQALKDDRFVTAIQSLGVAVKRSRDDLTRSQQRLLAVLQQPENRCKTLEEICQLAGYSSTFPWCDAIKDERFVAMMEALGVPTRRNNRNRDSHLEVKQACDIEEELAKDIWDSRKIKQDYPKHLPPGAYVVNFLWITNPVLREQIKHYFRQHIPHWEAYTFPNVINNLKPVLLLLPSEVHLGTLTRSHIEILLPQTAQLSEYQANRGLQVMQSMLEYMATSPAWTGQRPPRGLIWDEDIPRRPEALPRPIPPTSLINSTHYWSRQRKP